MNILDSERSFGLPSRIEECETCGRKGVPHFMIDNAPTFTFCSRECAEEYVRENTRVSLYKRALIDIHCAGCGEVISAGEHEYEVEESPFMYMLGKSFCCTEHAHDSMDSLIEASIRELEHNVLPISAEEFSFLTNISLKTISLFEGREESFYESELHGTLTSPRSTTTQDSSYSPTIDYYKAILGFMDKQAS